MSMYNLRPIQTQWKTRCITNGYETPTWDGEWYYHFSEGGFDSIEWVEIKIDEDKDGETVKNELKKIHVPGHETKNGFKVYGFIEQGQVIDFI